MKGKLLGSSSFSFGFQENVIVSDTNIFESLLKPILSTFQDIQSIYSYLPKSDPNTHLFCKHSFCSSQSFIFKQKTLSDCHAMLQFKTIFHKFMFLNHDLFSLIMGYISQNSWIIPRKSCRYGLLKQAPQQMIPFIGIG